MLDNFLAEIVSMGEMDRGVDEVKATISTGVSVNHIITILIALFGG